MIDGPPTEQTGSLELWTALQALVDQLQSAPDLDTLLVDALDLMLDILEADRGMIWVLSSDGQPVPIQGRSWKRRLSPREQATISRSTIQHVIDTGETVMASSTPDATAESIHFFGISCRMAGPLRTVSWGRQGAGGRESRRELRGVLYLDYRRLDVTLTSAHAQFFDAALRILGLLLDQQALHALARDRYARQDLQELSDDAANESIHLDDILAPASQAPLRRQLLPVLKTDAPILILGESGTGKSMMAAAIARASHRARPFVLANLGRTDDRNTLMSELFGHMRGSFTGAVSDRIGKVERAAGGTLFLDELLNLPIDLQPLLLDLLQDKHFEPLGWTGQTPRRANARIIAATNGDVIEAIRQGRFRADLYFRMAVTVITLLPLRQRREDIPMLAEQCLRRMELGATWTLAPDLREALTRAGLQWPGNVRQLQHLLYRAVARAHSQGTADHRLSLEHLEPEDLNPAHEALLSEAPREAALSPDSDSLHPPAASRESGSPGGTGLPLVPKEGSLSERYQVLKEARSRMDLAEAELIRDALQAHNGVCAWASEALGMPRTGLLSRLQTLGIEVPARRRRAKGAP